MALAKEDMFYPTAKTFGFFDFTALMILLILQSCFSVIDSIRKFFQTPEERKKGLECGCGKFFIYSFELFMLIVCGVNFSNGLKSLEITEFVKSKIPITYYITSIMFFFRILLIIAVILFIFIKRNVISKMIAKNLNKTDDSIEVVVLEH
jgi:hypothetical protein